jgi:SAM-dependent methyltransferase
MDNSYQGNELDLFAKAVNWKSYFSSFIIPYLNTKILEVGAGQGGTTEAFSKEIQDREWLCLEPDKVLCKKILKLIENKRLNNKIKVINGTIEKIEDKVFDTILYIDVAEHLESPEIELNNAIKILAENGYLIILVPAYNFLYSPFDRNIGHTARYNKKLLKSVVPSTLKKVDMLYLDSAGLLASIMNKYLLKQTIPTEKQILFWDTKLVNISKILDKLIFYSCGKSLLGIWQKK